MYKLHKMPKTTTGVRSSRRSRQANMSTIVLEQLSSVAHEHTSRVNVSGNMSGLLWSSL